MRSAAVCLDDRCGLTPTTDTQCNLRMFCEKAGHNGPLRTSHRAIFEPLRDRERFAQLYLDCELGTIAWEHGADFASEYLYEKLATVH